MMLGSVPKALVAMVRSTCSPLRRGCITQTVKGREEGNDLRFEKHSTAWSLLWHHVIWWSFCGAVFFLPLPPSPKSRVALLRCSFFNHFIPATSSRMSIATLYIFTAISHLLNFYLVLLLDHWHPRTLNCSNQRVMHPLGRYQIPSSHTRLRSSPRSSGALTNQAPRLPHSSLVLSPSPD
jgi:hypothetical protein